MTRRHHRRTGPPIALVAHPGSELYGSDRMVCESVDALVEAGFVVHVALPAGGPLQAEIERRGASCHLVTMPVLRKSALQIKGFGRLAMAAARSAVPTARLLLRLRPDVVYVSTQILPTWLLAARVARAVTVCHVHEAERHPSRIVNTGLVAPLALAQRIIVNSHYAADVLVDVLPQLKARTSVVYNGVAAPADPVPPREALRAPIRLLYVGRLSPRKGPDVALGATRLLREAGVDVALDLLGGVFEGYEWFEDGLRREYADLVAGGSVRFRGFERTVWPALAACDVALVPSTAPEPFGNTAVEAMLAGRPVVVSRSGGLPEAVGSLRSAAMVQPGDAAALAAAIRELVDGWERFATAAWEGRAFVRERFAPARYRRELADVVQAAMSDRLTIPHGGARAGRAGSGQVQTTQRHATIE